MSKIIAGEPSAWELRVRRADTEWRRYSVYETHEQVVYLAKQSGIDPGEVVRDLYAVVTGRVK